MAAGTTLKQMTLTALEVVGKPIAYSITFFYGDGLIKYVRSGPRLCDSLRRRYRNIIPEACLGHSSWARGRNHLGGLPRC